VEVLKLMWRYSNSPDISMGKVRKNTANLGECNPYPSRELNSALSNAIYVTYLAKYSVTNKCTNINYFIVLLISMYSPTRVSVRRPSSGG
jgi:hypothetical protein